MPQDDDDEWANLLKSKLQSAQIEVDEAVLDYVNSIVQLEDDDDDEKKEGLVDFLSEFTEEDINDVVAEIISLWKQNVATTETRNKEETARQAKEALDAKMAEIRLSATIPSTEASNPVDSIKSEEELRIKKALLRQYDEVASDEEDDEDESTGAAPKRLSAKKERRQRKQATAAELAMGHVNMNRGMSAQAIQAQKEQRRQESMSAKTQSKQANKDDKDKKAKAKEARRAAATKGERRR